MSLYVPLHLWPCVIQISEEFEFKTYNSLTFINKFPMICRIGPTFVVVDSCTSASAWEHRFPLDFPDCPEWAGICCCCRLVRCGWLMLVEDVLQRSSGTFLVSTAWMMRSLGHPRCFPAHRSYEKKTSSNRGTDHVLHSWFKSPLGILLEN